MSMLKGKKIGVVGAGNMGKALIGGLLQAQVILREHILVSDRRPERLQPLIEEFRVSAVDTPETISNADVVILAVKPQDMGALLDEMKEHFKEDQLVISIAAGLSTSFIQERIEARVPVVRVMPNLPVVVSLGASAYCLGSHATWPHGVVTSLIFSAVGSVVEVSEDQIDTVTAVSGTGPAYVFLLAELMTEAGTREGLPREISEYLAIQTIQGGAQMLVDSNDSPATLRAQVTSPGGTTAAAISSFEENGLHEIFYRGVHAARKRSATLSQEFGSSN